METDGSLLVRVLVACLIAAVCMSFTLMLIRLAARIVLFVVMIGACTIVAWQVWSGAWPTWPELTFGAAAVGAAAAILSFPVLPFSRPPGK